MDVPPPSNKVCRPQITAYRTGTWSFSALLGIRKYGVSAAAAASADEIAAAGAGVLVQLLRECVGVTTF